MLLVIIFSMYLSISSGMDQNLFKRIIFSDSIWENDYSKTEFQLAAGENGAVECGTMCSMRDDNCDLFMFDPEDGKCTLAKVNMNTTFAGTCV